jgi:ABC-type uncharacterized transport system permease subunit
MDMTTGRGNCPDRHTEQLIDATRLPRLFISSVKVLASFLAQRVCILLFFTFFSTSRSSFRSLAGHP